MSGNYQTCLDAMAAEDSPKRAEARAFMLTEYGVTIGSEDEPTEIEVFLIGDVPENVTSQNVD